MAAELVPNVLTAVQQLEPLGPLDPQCVAYDVCLGFTDVEHPDILTLRYFQGAFYQYSGGVYRELDKEEIRQQVFLCATAAAKHTRTSRWDPTPLPVTRARVEDTLNALKAFTLVPGTEMPMWLGPLDEDQSAPKYLNCSDGLLDATVPFVDADLIPHTPLWFSTIQLPYPGGLVTHETYDDNGETIVHVMQFDDGSVVESQQSCPKWEAFLDTVFEGDGERIALLQEFAGYLLSEGNSCQKMLILYGEAGTGKTTVLDVLMALVGPVNVSKMKIDKMFDKFALVQTFGKLLNVSNELKAKQKIEEGELKDFIDGGEVQSDRKNLPHLKFRATAKLVMACNHFPAFEDTTDGMWRRVLVLPFDVQLKHTGKQVVDYFETHLRQELPGILHWALVGRDRLRVQMARKKLATSGMDNYPFTNSAAGLAALSERRQDADPMGEFLKLYQAAPSTESISSGSVFEHYIDWCEQQDVEQPASREALGIRIKSVFPKSFKKSKRIAGTLVRHYVGLAKV